MIVNTDFNGDVTGMVVWQNDQTLVIIKQALILLG